MILFVPAYDPQTHGNLDMAKAIAPSSCRRFFQDEALGENLKTELRQNPAPLFVMSHGEAKCFFDQQGQPALLPEDAYLLYHLPTFVFACLTSNEFGKLAAQKNTVYLGYTGTIQSLDLPQKVSALFQPVFQNILDHFAHLADTFSIQTFLLNLKTSCDQVAAELDILQDAGELDHPMAAYACVRDLWNKLKVHHPHSSEPMTHPDAETGDLYDWN
jgi:hypothetical protein